MGTLYVNMLTGKGLARSRALDIDQAMRDLHTAVCQCDGSNMELARELLLSRPLGQVLDEFGVIEELRHDLTQPKAAAITGGSAHLTDNGDGSGMLEVRLDNGKKHTIKVDAADCQNSVMAAANRKVETFGLFVQCWSGEGPWSTRLAPQPMLMD